MKRLTSSPFASITANLERKSTKGRKRYPVVDKVVSNVTTRILCHNLKIGTGRSKTDRSEQNQSYDQVSRKSSRFPKYTRIPKLVTIAHKIMKKKC